MIAGCLAGNEQGSASEKAFHRRIGRKFLISNANYPFQKPGPLARAFLRQVVEVSGQFQGYARLSLRMLYLISINI